LLEHYPDVIALAAEEGLGVSAFVIHARGPCEVTPLAVAANFVPAKAVGHG